MANVTSVFTISPIAPRLFPEGVKIKVPRRWEEKRKTVLSRRRKVKCSQNVEGKGKKAKSP